MSAAQVIALILATLIGWFPAGLQASSPRVVLTPAPGYTISWDGNNGGFNSPALGAGPSNNVALASNGTTAFASSQLDFGVHFTVNINDGFYGNANSWIADFTIPDPDPYIGLAFSAAVDISGIAWGRDNGNTVMDACGGTCMDRSIGTYTLQFTQVATPGTDTFETEDAATGWVTIGTIQYLPGTDDADFTAYLRHRFDVSEGGNPINATGLRIKVSDVNTAIDEIEVNPIPDPVPPLSTFVQVSSAPGYTIRWDGNDGNFSAPDSTPAFAPANAALASAGATAFGSSELNLGVHFIANVNDGLYGNAHSWIADFSNGDAAPFIGISFGDCLNIRSIAWSRDNGDVAGDCCGGTLKDRALGLYTLQITVVPNADASTPETEDSLTGWVTVGTVHYKAEDPSYFNAYLRHRFDLSAAAGPVLATAVRIKVPDANIAIDEIEINVNQTIEKELVQVSAAPGLSISWDGNEGHFNNPEAIALAPANRALASEGTIPFTSSDLGPILSIPFHVAANLNDGLYGNANSWISANGVGGTDDPDPFAGLNFGGTVAITNIAWGRDNGNTITDACGGTCTDRTMGTYRLQYTLVENPDASTVDTGDPFTGWADIGTVTYGAAAPPDFLPYLRHRFELSEAGNPIEATGIRIKVPDGFTDIDEIEINTSVTPPPPVEPPLPIAIASAPGFDITFDGNNGHYNNPAAGAAPPANRALASQGTVAFGSSQVDLGVHFIANVNDGLYGNAHSWIPDFINGDAAPFIGVSFGELVEVTNLAWSRDNGDAAEGTFADRALGLYTLQVTQVANPDASTAETEDAATGWVTVGTIDYQGELAGRFNSYLRHRFDVSENGGPIAATGLRLKVPNSGSDLDELEVNTATEAPPSRLSIQRSGDNIVVSWTGNGVLEVAPDSTGPWTDCFTGGSNPYRTPVSAGKKRFYRLRQ